MSHRVVNDTFEKYCRYSIPILASKVSSIPIPILSRKSIDVDIDISISILRHYIVHYNVRCCAHLLNDGDHGGMQ